MGATTSDSDPALPAVRRGPRRPERAERGRHPDVPPPGVRPAVRGRPGTGPVPADPEALVRRPLRDRPGLRAIARVTGRSRSWLQRLVDGVSRGETPWEPGPLKKSPARS